MLRVYSLAGASPILRVEIILKSSLKYSVYSSDKSGNENGGHYFVCLLKKALF